MRILTTSGSTRPESSNQRLLRALPALAPQHEWHYHTIGGLPLFCADQDHAPWAMAVQDWRAAISACDALVISTPAYLHNIPAALKNALEWLASSGELVSKPVLPIVFTPHPPRGESALQSLLWSLQALDARVVTQFPLHHNDLLFDQQEQLAPSEGRDLLVEALSLLG